MVGGRGGGGSSKWSRGSPKDLLVKLFQNPSTALEKESFKAKCWQRMDDGRRTNTDYNSSP